MPHDRDVSPSNQHSDKDKLPMCEWAKNSFDRQLKKNQNHLKFAIQKYNKRNV